LATANQASLAGIPVLIIEDQPPVALDLQEIATELGASRVRVAASVGEGQRLFDEEAAGLVILDISRRDERHAAFVERLRQARVALVLSTAEEEPADAGLAGLPLLRKPYFDHELREAVARALATR